jgi:hypothetical protein
MFFTNSPPYDWQGAFRNSGLTSARGATEMIQLANDPRTSAVLEELMNGTRQEQFYEGPGIKFGIFRVGTSWRAEIIFLGFFREKPVRVQVWFSHETGTAMGSYQFEPPEAPVAEQDIVESLVLAVHSRKWAQSKLRPRRFSPHSTIGRRVGHMAQCARRLQDTLRQPEADELDRLRTAIACHATAIGELIAKGLRSPRYNPKDGAFFDEAHVGGIVVQMRLEQDGGDREGIASVLPGELLPYLDDIVRGFWEFGQE